MTVRLSRLKRGSIRDTMKKHITTPDGEVKPGTRIRIIEMKATATPSPAFPDGIDHQAKEYEGKVFTVSFIDDQDQIHLEEGGLAVISGEDLFEIIK